MIFPSLRRPRPAADHPGSVAHEPGSDVEVSIGGRKFISFAGNDWFGFGKHPEVIAAGCRAFARFGLGGPDKALVQDLEERAAGFIGKEAAVLLGSAPSANDLLVKVAGEMAAVFVDECAQPRMKAAALMAGVPVYFFRSCDPEDLRAKISSLLPERGVPAVMSDGIIPATGIVPPLDQYMSALADYPQAVLIVDDRLGPGAIGPRSRGSLDELGLDESSNRVGAVSGVAVFCSSGVPLAGGLCGAVVSGSRDFAEQARRKLVEEDLPCASVIAAAAKALEVASTELQAARAALSGNSARLRQGMSQLSLELPKVPAPFFGLQIGTAENIARIHKELLAAGIIVPIVPAPGTGEVLRFAVSSSHTHAMIDALLRALCVIL